MRRPIVVQVEPFDDQKLRSDVVQIRADFARYLSGVPRKSKESKHGLMGPVGKLLSKIKTGMKDPDQLKGYILNVDRAVRTSLRIAKKLSPEGMGALERGINSTCELLKKAPPTVHDVLIDQLDYGLYFDLRKAETVAKEVRRQAWIGFVRDKYGSETRLSEAWGEEISAFDDLYLLRKAEGSKTKKATARQRDIAAFWESQGAAAVTEEEEE
jgi:hypothetical protein